MLVSHCGTYENNVAKKRRTRNKQRTEARRIELFDLRRAMSGDDRFARLALAITDLRRSVSKGAQVHIIWPADRDVPIAGALLGRPLAHCIGRAPGPGSIVIHMKSGSASSFIGFPAISKVSIVMHVNCEEAAMKWESNDASPIRRLAAASQLTSAGWKTVICVGPVRLYKGFKTDYRELFGSMKSFGFYAAHVRFAGDDFNGFIAGNIPASPVRTTFAALMAKCLSGTPQDLLGFSRAA